MNNTISEADRGMPSASQVRARRGTVAGLALLALVAPSLTWAERSADSAGPEAAEYAGEPTAIPSDRPPIRFSPPIRIPGAGLTREPWTLAQDDTPSVLREPKTLAQTGSAQLRPPAAADTSTPPWGTQKSYLIPALEIVGFDTLLNLFDRAYFGCCDFDVTINSIERNLHRSWVVDSDSFNVNQLGHPYQGSMYHGFARASGLNFWESWGYTFLGSALWEIAGETTPPSKNDQISTGIGGSFLGEALFRMSNLWLERGRTSRFWREVGAAAISPPVGFNRLAFGNRFDGIFSSHSPDYYSRVRVGIAATTQNRPGTASDINREEAVFDFALDYGLPGKPGYTYKRPFDYFSFEAAASSAIGFENVATRGLLLGSDYEVGKKYRGIWGLYGSYDYVAPQIFRLASTALSLGTTGEWRASNAFSVRGSALLGVGYATVSTVNDIANERSNHYGIAPQAMLFLRLIFGDRASLDLAAREYFVSDVSSGSRGGDDNIVRTEAAFTWRIQRQHAVTLKYQFSRRDAQFPDLGDRTQTRGTLG
ncbi:MAG: DUF3943 domain-containing protein, partial [Burkholderiales bacterium]